MFNLIKKIIHNDINKMTQNHEINIELEITLRCNSTCPQCSRHCNVFSYGESDMTTEQINKFIEQILTSEAKLGHITIMGGEPTVHPKLEEITFMLYDSIVKTGKARYLEIATNDIIDIPHMILKIPVKIRRSTISSKRHRCQYIAPKDTGQKTKPCNIPDLCGFALNYFGYFPCGAGGAIIRLFDMKNLIRYKLPLSINDFGDITQVCSLCQASAVDQRMFGIDDPTPSESFKKAIENYYLNKPCFKRF